VVLESPLTGFLSAVQPEGLKRNSPRATPWVTGSAFPLLSSSFFIRSALKGRNGLRAENEMNENPRERLDHCHPPVAPFQGFKEEETK